MDFADTIWHIRAAAPLLLATLVATGCGSSHEAGGDGLGDAGGDTDGGMRGSDAAVGSDGAVGTDGSLRTDAGRCRTVDCYGGPCCNDKVAAEIDEETCAVRCPEGYAPFDECTTAPGARCPAPWLSCEHNTDCELAINTCCSPCGEPSLSDFDAINKAHREAHRESVCPEPTGCPACPVAPNPALGATCNDGKHCNGFDVRAMELSSCSVDEDCRLRVTECCECGGDSSPYSLIAIRKDAATDYRELVCDEGTACPACAPAYPREVEAYCADDGHCDVGVHE